MTERGRQVGVVVPEDVATRRDGSHHDHNPFEALDFAPWRPTHRNPAFAFVQAFCAWPGGSTIIDRFHFMKPISAKRAGVIVVSAGALGAVKGTWIRET